jgi:hypothetical protein
MLSAHTDPNESPTYDGADDTLIGVLNLSPDPVPSIRIDSNTTIFGFDRDGICDISIFPRPAGCPFGPNHYEGPGVSFGSISTDRTSGAVNLNPAIPASGGTAYFGLENAIVTECVDTDGDALCDDWERFGLDVYANGSIVHLDLPKMGADRCTPTSSSKLTTCLMSDGWGWGIAINPTLTRSSSLPMLRKRTSR